MSRSEVMEIGFEGFSQRMDREHDSGIYNRFRVYGVQMYGNRELGTFGVVKLFIQGNGGGRGGSGGWLRQNS